MSSVRLRITIVVVLCSLLVICLMPYHTQEAEQYVGEKESVQRSVRDSLDRRNALQEAGTSHSLARRERSGTAKLLVVRGLVRMGSNGRLPGAELEALLFEGYEATGSPVRVSRIVCGSDGSFAWVLPQPETTVTLQFRSGSPDLHVWLHKKGHIIPRGTVAPRENLVFAFPID